MVPIMSRERFAELVGVSDDTVRGWMNNGYIPTVKIGRHRVVNLLALSRECLEREEY
jgi:excisionase family DNA binding protein